jgi:hypothetical protein
MAKDDQKPHLNRGARRAIKKEDARKKKKAEDDLAKAHLQAELIANLVSQKQKAKAEKEDKKDGGVTGKSPKLTLVIGTLAVWSLTLSLSAPFNYYGGRPKILYIPAIVFFGFTLVWSHNFVRVSKKSVWGYSANLVSIAICVLTYRVVESETTRLASESSQRGQEHNVITNLPTAIAAMQGQLANLAAKGPNPTREQIIAEMGRSEKNLGAALSNYFRPDGYALLTATESRLIIPLKSEINKHIVFHWESGYSITMTSNFVAMTLPNMTINTEHSQGINITHAETGFDRRPGATRNMGQIDDKILECVLLSTNENRVMVAVGLVFAPPRPIRQSPPQLPPRSTN